MMMYTDKKLALYNSLSVRGLSGCLTNFIDIDLGDKILRDVEFEYDNPLLGCRIHFIDIGSGANICSKHVVLAEAKS